MEGNIVKKLSCFLKIFVLKSMEKYSVRHQIFAI